MRLDFSYDYESLTLSGQPRGDEKMTTYTIESESGETRTAVTIAEAIVIAQQMMIVRRAWRGAQYRSDREVDSATDRRENCTCLDMWRTPSDAREERSACAPVVISW